MFTCQALKTERHFSAQLWQVAAVIGFAARYHVNWVLPTWSSSARFEHVAPQTAFPLHIDAVLTPANADHFDSRYLSDRWIVDLQGGFECAHHFQDSEALVRRHFEPRQSLVCEVLARYAEFLSGERICVVVAPFQVATASIDRIEHRRVLSREALTHVRDDSIFAVMSDDPTWWDAQLFGARVLHLPRNEIVSNFIFGLFCNDVIVIDSAFGWWMANLNRREHKRVFLLESASESI